MLIERGVPPKVSLGVIQQKIADAVAPWAGFIFEFCGLAFLSAVAIVVTILPERWNAEGGVSQPVIAAWFALAVFILSSTPFKRSMFNFNLIFVFLAVITKRLDYKPGALIAAAQIAGAFAGVIIAQYGLNLDPVQAPDFGGIDLRHAVTEGFAGFCLGYLVLLNFSGSSAMPSLKKVPEIENKRLSDEIAQTPSHRESKHNRSVIGGALAMAAISFVFIGFGPGLAFGNPAITLARTLTANALGLSPAEALLSAVSALLGAAASWLIYQMREKAPIEP